MADRITDEVNGILCQEAGAPTLSKQAVLDLIDQGASQGGPQAGPTWLHPKIPASQLHLVHHAAWLKPLAKYWQATVLQHWVMRADHLACNLCSMYHRYIPDCTSLTSACTT